MESPDLRGKTVLAVGLARSGCAVGALLRRHGARVLGLDDADEDAVRARWRDEGIEALAAGAFDEVVTGGDWGAVVSRAIDAVALSPGVPLTHARLRELAERVPVRGELEWAWRFFAGTAVAITGTNGKSTTTELVAHLARAVGRDALALGNVGRPFALEADRMGPDSLAVLEVSSFQLETIERFRPRVGAVLNLAPDHLDRHGGLEGYYAAKRRLAAALPADGRFVTWTGCDEARAWRPACPTVLFGDRDRGAAVHVTEGRIWWRPGGRDEALVETGALALRSRANLLNACAAVAVLDAFAPDPAGLAEGLRSFRGLEHRQQTVARLGGVDFVDDSKATNVAAVRAGLEGYPGRVVLIAGGRGKGEDYAPLRGVMSSVAAVVVIGEEGPAIAAALAGVVPVHAARSLEEAVARASGLAAPRGAVLLSPACASFDMFRNYHERGRAFRAAAVALGAEEVA
jgi:UDP-N-acetylmuramoylalanine--D-glutamate ligase